MTLTRRRRRLLSSNKTKNGFFFPWFSTPKLNQWSAVYSLLVPFTLHTPCDILKNPLIFHLNLRTQKKKKKMGKCKTVWKHNGTNKEIDEAIFQTDKQKQTTNIKKKSLSCFYFSSHKCLFSNKASSRWVVALSCKVLQKFFFIIILRNKTHI